MSTIELHSSRFPSSCYVKYGEGPAIMLVHGFAEDNTIWTNQIESLSKHYTVLVPDLPGTGHSALPQERMSMELLADFLIEILKQEQLSQVQLFGHSMGGYAALAFAEYYPNYLLSLGLIHSSAFADDEEKKVNRRKSIALIQGHEQGKSVFLKAMVPNLYADDKLPSLETAIEQHLTTAMKISSESLVAYYEAMIERKERIQVLQHMKAPVLFVIGDKDRAVPFEQSLKQSSMPQQSKIAIFRETGHTSMNENPQLLNETLLTFAYDVLELQLT